MRRALLPLLAVLAWAAAPGGVSPPAAAQNVTLDNYFRTLKRPDSPNTWLIAPANFVIKPDAVAPVFDAPVAKLRESFRSVMATLEHTEVVAESADGAHIVATTPVMRFKDDVRVLFIPVGERNSTIALYSASRTGYWDLGANRRRLEKWLEEIRNALASGRK